MLNDRDFERLLVSFGVRLKCESVSLFEGIELYFALNWAWAFIMFFGRLFVYKLRGCIRYLRTGGKWTHSYHILTQIRRRKIILLIFICLCVRAIAYLTHIILCWGAKTYSFEESWPKEWLRLVQEILERLIIIIRGERWRRLINIITRVCLSHLIQNFLLEHMSILQTLCKHVKSLLDAIYSALDNIEPIL
jgi:hypothetical protein